MGRAERVARRRQAHASRAAQAQASINEQRRQDDLFSLSGEVANLTAAVTAWLAANDYPDSELIGQRGFLRRQRAAWKIGTYVHTFRTEKMTSSIYLLADGTFAYGTDPQPMSFLQLCDELRYVTFDPSSIKRELEGWVARHNLG